MPTLNFDRYRKAAGGRNIVLAGRAYDGRPFSVSQFIAYAEKMESGEFSEAEELRMNVDAIVSRLRDAETGDPIDRALVEDMSAEELRMIVDFLSTAKTREKMPPGLRERTEETWREIDPYLDEGFEGPIEKNPGPGAPPTTERSTSDFASTGSSESTGPLASPTAQ